MWLDPALVCEGPSVSRRGLLARRPGPCGERCNGRGWQCFMKPQKWSVRNQNMAIPYFLWYSCSHASQEASAKNARWRCIWGSGEAKYNPFCPEVHALISVISLQSRASEKSVLEHQYSGENELITCRNAVWLECLSCHDPVELTPWWCDSDWDF